MTSSKIQSCQDFPGTEAINGVVGLAGKKFHFIGAGGVGMSGLAQILVNNKAIISGSDQIDSAVLSGLCGMGADIKIGHDQSNLSPQTDAVVISAAIEEANPELKAARSMGCKVYKYAEMLGELFNCYEGIAMSGTHGKSTTGGWLVCSLKAAGLDPNFIIGAEISQLKCSSGTGQGKSFIAEACEYDRSFLNLKPAIACILNIEQDHLDYYKDEDQIVDAFLEFALGIKPGGILIANGIDPNVAKVLSRLPNSIRYETFGLDEKCNYYAKNLELVDGLYHFEVCYNGKSAGQAKISLPGLHNVFNALAVVAVGVNAGLEAEKVIETLGNFVGMDRRLMLKSKIDGITILDDYAHHPTEIRASLEAIRQKYQPKRILCIFQPHQYSRTRFLLDDFAKSFKLADITIAPEIYFVRDSLNSKKEVNSQILVERIRDDGSDAIFIEGFGEICDYLKENVTAGDLVVTMGAGDIWKVADDYIQWLRSDN